LRSLGGESGAVRHVIAAMIIGAFIDSSTSFDEVGSFF